MTARYEAQGWIKFAEVDNYEHGCEPGTAHSSSGPEVFFGATPEEVVQQCCDCIGVEPDSDDVLRDSCEEPGRLDVQRMETDAGDLPSTEELEAWRKGKVRLWLATYTFYIEKVSREAVSLALAQRN